MPRFVLLLSIALILPAAPAGDESCWPQWRGPRLDGTSPCRGLPTEWSEDKNILWKVPLPSWGGATPIVWNDRVFVTSPSEPHGGPVSDRSAPQSEGTVTRKLPRQMGREHPGGKELLLLCFDAADGKLLWKRTLDDRNTLFGKQNMSSPSPVTDGRHVWALTGTGVLTAFDMEGNHKWRVDLQEQFGEFRLLWGYASSPLLADDLLIVQVLHGSTEPAESYLVAFDAAGGNVRWREVRRTDATRECPDAYTTPTLCTAAGRTELIVSGADYVTGHDLTTGRERWRAAGLNPQGDGNYRIVASPLVVGDIIIAPTRVRPLLALRAGGEGDVTESHLAWKLTRSGPDVPTPVSDGRRVYIVNDKGIVVCVDAKTGENVWGPERTAIGTVSASPLLADGKLYVTNESAVTTVLRAAPQFEVLATNQLDDGYTISSLAAANSRLYVRTSSHLYCIGERK